MKLQILINHYGDSDFPLSRLLESINRQESINKKSVEILICTDGYECELSNMMFKTYSFPIRYYVRPHMGVCATRNYLLDLAVADYLMFCDCDDVFSQTNGLQVLFDAIEKTNANIIGSAYDMEIKNGHNFENIELRQNKIRVHGKIFKRQYLIDQHIRFPDEMLFSGDMYFLYLAYHLTDDIVWLSDNFYIWKWMPVSVTRGKTYYSVRTYDKMIQCYILVMREFQKRKRMDLCEELVVNRINASYIDYFSKSFSNAPDELADIARESIRNMVLEFSAIYLSVPIEVRQRSYKHLLLSRRSYGPPKKFLGLEEWIYALVHCSA